jgi:hypothetical protein
MKKSNFIIVIGISIIFLMSCHKENSTSTTSTTTSVLDYFPLKTGNYWVYKPFQVDTSGNIVPLNWKNDSIVVNNDTVINNNSYHTITEYNYLGSTNSNIYYYRDSANCIVDNFGDIIFSINSGVIYKKYFDPDTIAFNNSTYINTTTSITVPLGTYSCVDFKGDVFRKIDNYNKAYLIHKYCYIGIGIVKHTELFITSLEQIQLELVKYHVQ